MPQRRGSANHAATDAARLRRLGGFGGNHLGRLSRRYGQVLVEKVGSKGFDSRRLHQVSCRAPSRLQGRDGVRRFYTLTFGVAGRSSQVHRARLHHVADRSRACVRESLENHFKTEVRFKQPLSEHSQIGGANKCRSET